MPIIINEKMICSEKVAGTHLCNKGMISTQDAHYQCTLQASRLIVKQENKVNNVDTLSYKTISANKATAQKEWVVVDATGHSMGRLASEVAKILRGKHKASFTPHVDCGDNVIIINAEKAVLTGAKWTERTYLSYSLYPGGQKEMSPERMVKVRGWEALYRKVVKGMLPKNRLGAKLLNNLYVYEGPDHKHEAQQPRTIEIKTR